MHLLISFFFEADMLRWLPHGPKSVLYKRPCCLALPGVPRPGVREKQKGETNGSIDESDEGHVHNMPSIIYMYMRDVGRIAVATATMCWGFVWVFLLDP
jgi:hypothetical protein